MARGFTNGDIFGPIKAALYTIEFQKRGLPHAHIILFLATETMLDTPQDIDRFISAEIPNKDEEPELYEAVNIYMMHGPCSVANPKSPCMVNGSCSKFYPKSFNSSTIIHEDGYPRYRRLDNGQEVMKNGIPLDNRSVIPYNSTLLLKYQAHINVERTKHGESIKYLFKYVSKGHDRAIAAFYTETSSSDSRANHDEIKMYYDVRYLSPCEAIWRILSYDINFRTPSVQRLSFHLPNQQSIIYEDNADLQEVVNHNAGKLTMFEAWMNANKLYGEARRLTYFEFPNNFVYKKNGNYWDFRKSGFAIGRLYYVPPGSGEIYYLRLLLATVRGPTSYEDLRTVDSIFYPTFRDACYALGLLEDDREYIDAMKEANQWAWLLQVIFVDYPSMPLPEDCSDRSTINRLILAELDFDRVALQHQLHEYLNSFTDEQATIFNSIMNAVNTGYGGVFFVYGYGGTGKTYLWQALCASLRSEGKIVLSVASRGIASLLLPNGKTAHSQFAIPLAITEDSVCNIHQGSPLAELLIETTMIIWDEALMANKYYFEALDRTLRDIMKLPNPNAINQVFGGKTIVLGGNSSQCSKEIAEFARWIVSVGDGEIDVEDGTNDTITIPEDLLLFPSSDAMDCIIGDEVVYLSADSVSKQDGISASIAQMHSVEFLNKITMFGLPNHKLVLKIGSPIMMMRNLDKSIGLCNGTRLVVTRLEKHVIGAEIITGIGTGQEVLIPRITITPSETSLPFALCRSQFPIMLSFAMTINKSQGQTLTNVGLFLPCLVFTRGQLYVAISRVQNKQGLKILILDDQGNPTNKTSNRDPTTGQPAPPDQVWEITHTRKTADGQLQWVDSRSEEIHDRMHELVQQQSLESDARITSDEILTAVLGERSGYVRGKGYGAEPRRKRLHTQSSDSLENVRTQLYEEFERRFQEEREKMEANLAAERERMEAERAAEREKIEAERAAERAKMEAECTQLEQRMEQLMEQRIQAQFTAFMQKMQLNAPADTPTSSVPNIDPST
ncbi:uncharacterized protein LOC114755171 [Neltuma alba]|uniref:uncharacterized protein LOC114755171 n=1 Tax=Neltuma alba TaxID=207710 RepID=UPI0010A4D530|nr:uncharacterized protein LOC114755171 [Prosopis alba]